MKLADILNRENGLEMSYLVGCYERYRQCPIPHTSQTSLCRQELYQEELTPKESSALRNAITLFGSIQSTKVYHLGKVGIDEFRKQDFLREKNISDSFDISPPIYTPEICEEYKKKASAIPVSSWLILTAGVVLLTLSFASPLLKNSFRFYFSPSVPAFPKPRSTVLASAIPRPVRKLAASLLAGIFANEEMKKLDF